MSFDLQHCFFFCLDFINVNVKGVYTASAVYKIADGLMQTLIPVCTLSEMLLKVWLKYALFNAYSGVELPYITRPTF